jgi:hypothetical protein
MSEHVTVTRGSDTQIDLFEVTRGGRVSRGTTTRTAVTAEIRGGTTLVGYVIPASYGRVYFGLLPESGATTVEVQQEISRAMGSVAPAGETR